MILISPSFALEEIEKYADEIIKKAKIDHVTFRKKRKELQKSVRFVPLHEYKDTLSIATALTNMLTNNEKEELLNDIDFLALALKERCPIWTNDKLFKKQNTIIILNTREIIELLA